MYYVLHNMELSTFITFNGLITVYRDDDEVIHLLSGNINKLHSVIELNTNKELCREILGDKITKLSFYFSHKEGNIVTNIPVKLGQIKQLCQFITKPENLI